MKNQKDLGVLSDVVSALDDKKRKNNISTVFHFTCSECDGYCFDLNKVLQNNKIVVKRNEQKIW